MTLAASYLPGPPATAPATVPAVVVVPGFAAHRHKPAYVRLARRLSAEAAVLAVDLRGHGASGGACTLGEREPLDVRAALEWTRAQGHQWIALVGASLGGAAVLAAAASVPAGSVQAVCAISSPAVWTPADTPVLRRIAGLTRRRWSRAATAAVLRVRVAAVRGDCPAPHEAVAAITDVPLLLVHGIDDHVCPPDAVEVLAAAAAGPCAVWHEPVGFGHAEDGFTVAFCARLAGALRAARLGGAFPEASVSAGPAPLAPPPDRRPRRRG